MPTTKTVNKKDLELVSYKQYWEPAWIARRFKVNVSVVRLAMLAVGKDGKYSRSRGKIYAYLIGQGYKLQPVKRK